MEENIREINQQAESVIEGTIRNRRLFKASITDELLGFVNGICSAHNLAYFAMGRLVTLALEGKDTYPDTMDYHIGLLRHDYDVFLEALRTETPKAGLSLTEMYDENGCIQKLHSYLEIEREKKTKNDYYKLTLRLWLEPYDNLPDGEEREEFLEDVLANTKEMIARSSANKRKHLPGYDPVRRIARTETGRAKTMQAAAAYYHDLVSSRKEDSEYVCRMELEVYRPVPLKSILPVRAVPFQGTQIMLPADTDYFGMPSKEVLEEDTVEKRKELLQQLDRLCGKYHIDYMAVGSLASLAAHGGDVPEDTQLKPWRIALLRPQYKKLVKTLREEGEEYGLELRGENLIHPQLHAEHLYIVRCQEQWAQPWVERGAWLGTADSWIEKPLIEIYPMDPLPNGTSESIAFLKDIFRQTKQLKELLDAEMGRGFSLKMLEMDSSRAYEICQKSRQRYAAAGEDTQKVFAVIGHVTKIYSRKELFPTGREKLGDLQISMPRNRLFWHEKSDDLYSEEVARKRTQILKLVDQICTERNLRYFAIGNLLIGAVIYHDYVPGSNASKYDLALLRPEYEELIRFMREHASEYGLQLNEYQDADQMLPLRLRTISFPDGQYSSVSIRLLPFDKVPEDFRLYQGFIKDINLNNKRLEQLLKYNSQKNFNTLIKNPLTRTIKNQIKKKQFIWKDLKENGKKTVYLQTSNLKKEMQRIDRFAQSFNDDERTHTYARVAYGRSKKISEDELFPLVRVPFRDMMLSCPKDYTIWQPQLDGELARQTSCIQKADLLIIQELDRICQKHGIGYFICGGTQLGYMRHEGFIPWDDDVDVGMLRSDYDRFLQVAEKELSEGFFLQTRKTDPNIPYLFSKIRMDHTEYITTYNEFRDFHKGVCLDIFPFDYLPDHPQLCQGFIKEVLKYSREHHDLANRKYGDVPKLVEPRNALERRYYREEEQELQKYRLLDLGPSQKKYVDAATRYNAQAQELGLTIVASFIPTFTYVDLNDLLPYQRGMFAGVEVSLAKRPDVFLEMQYGDYMQLPPPHLRVPHPLIRWSTLTDSSDKLPEKEEDDK